MIYNQKCGDPILMMIVSLILQLDQTIIIEFIERRKMIKLIEKRRKMKQENYTKSKES